jgi:alpha-beta hydrolase superfamily lysophospholipase
LLTPPDAVRLNSRWNLPKAAARRNLGETRQKVDAPVLVIRGTNDIIMSRADNAAIVETVNRVYPGTARLVEAEGMSHGLTVDEKFYSQLVPTILDWMKQHLPAAN